MSHRVTISDAAEAEADAAYLWMLRRSPARAARWYSGLLQAIASLAEFPTRCPRARESHRFNREIRQLLYGTGATAYRILFTIIEPGDLGDEPEVRVLHIRHAAQRDLGEDNGA